MYRRRSELQAECAARAAAGYGAGFPPIPGCLVSVTVAYGHGTELPSPWALATVLCSCVGRRGGPARGLLPNSCGGSNSQPGLWDLQNAMRLWGSASGFHGLHILDLDRAVQKLNFG